ncbi:hypothetical protein IVB27_11650 [Bradyrhizobium sp. 197]|uniref:hypothetical protein n=1 Tax=Bradyrhizobium sp. 197 TaxID=2782663 RepID=UPI001FF7CA2B|nr:hypothetical protein [Bradyrhizobium sp. 197]MCK1475439.1 hypothetical protein [Bradyrhizobium sp. 197]
MDQNDTELAPDARSVLKFIATRVWGFKWLIGSAALVVAALVFAFYRPSTTELWTGKSKLTIGMAPPLPFVLQRSGPPLVPLEPPRELIGRMSAQDFKNKVASRAAFDPKTASLSKDMVISSLRGIVLDDRDVAVELSAGSPGDIHAAFAALAAEISEVHGELLKRYLQPLRAQIDDANARVALIEKASENLNERLLTAESSDKNRSGPAIGAPSITPTLPAWNQLKDRIQVDENLSGLTEPTVVWSAPPMLSIASRSVGTLRQSLTAGFLMLVAIGLLTLAISPKAKS